MKRKSAVILLALIVSMLLAMSSTGFAEQAEIVEIEGGQAEVTLVEGNAELFRKEPDLRRTLNQADMVGHGDGVTTGDKTRIELAMADGSFLRFDEKTTFELISVDYDEQNRQRNIKVHTTLGKTWARVADIVGSRGSFQVSSNNAIAGVRGTTFRMNVNPDTSVVVKVYWGEIHVSSPAKRVEGVPEVSKPGKVEGPHPVEGPRPIEGPRPVTMQEWTYIVRAMQQIVVRPDGTVVKPFSFDPEVDANDWVRWNQKRDQMQP
jgi:ferric-dicitrate binding protein FerR (iron transport regulator)